MLDPLPSGRKFKPRKAWFSGNRQSCRNLGFPDFIGYFINFSIRSGSVFYPRNLACSDPAWVYDQETLLFVFGLWCIDFKALCAQGGNRRSLSRANGTRRIGFQIGRNTRPPSLCVSNLYPPIFSSKSQFI
ncbi:uncharacterized protein LOC103963101 [Pyrus x bretschneideri]|uniref:uncharacterized protein LOC103963101 n=1 Tax=Pyrus x bretschneideri TaxID=225117 RepID=UPI00202EC318|nr:uncharacterized protein LOC103963101 [Pyrus x bretschneideri]